MSDLQKCFDSLYEKTHPHASSLGTKNTISLKTLLEKLQLYEKLDKKKKKIPKKSECWKVLGVVVGL